VTDENRALILEIKSDLMGCTNIQYVEMLPCPNGLYAFRVGLKNQGEVPGWIWEKFPPNLWAFIIDLKEYKSNRGWAFYDRVGNALFKWHMGHWRRITGGFSPLFDPETDRWDRERNDRVLTLGTEGFPESRIIDEWEPA
jgi:hypothetical protein